MPSILPENIVPTESKASDNNKQTTISQNATSQEDSNNQSENKPDILTMIILIILMIVILLLPSLKSVKVGNVQLDTISIGSTYTLASSMAPVPLTIIRLLSTMSVKN